MDMKIGGSPADNEATEGNWGRDSRREFLQQDVQFDQLPLA